MTIYHGTNKETAERVFSEKMLLSENSKGVSICLTIEQALKHATEKCTKDGSDSKKMGRVLVIENITSRILNTASKDDRPETFTLNDELGQPANILHLQRVKVIGIKEAEYLYAMGHNEFKEEVA